MNSFRQMGTCGQYIHRDARNIMQISSHLKRCVTTVTARAIIGPKYGRRRIWLQRILSWGNTEKWLRFIACRGTDLNVSARFYMFLSHVFGQINRRHRKNMTLAPNMWQHRSTTFDVFVTVTVLLSKNKESLASLRLALDLIEKRILRWAQFWSMTYVLAVQIPVTSYPGCQRFFSRWGRQNWAAKRRRRIGKRREKNLWHQRITTSLPCRRQFPLIDIHPQSLF